MCLYHQSLNPEPGGPELNSLDPHLTSLSQRNSHEDDVNKRMGGNDSHDVTSQNDHYELRFSLRLSVSSGC